MPTLSPTEAATLASQVALLLKGNVSKLRNDFGVRFGTEGKFNLGDESQFSGATGLPVWKTLSSFGYIAAGVGDFKKEVVVVTRGTKIALDWLTNITIGMQPGPAGWPVHLGFHNTWKSFSSELAMFMARSDATHVHCVGHSLGGALACLTADWVSSSRMAGVSLYTFGAPRCGDAVFSRALTQRVGADHVFRVYHPADIVPMIPMFPFFHAPLLGGGLRLPTGSGALFSIDAHDMADSYLTGLTGRTWQGLAAGQGPGPNDGIEVQGWLEASAQGHGTMLMGSAKLLTMIGRALAWLVRKAAWALGSALGSGITAGLTLVDQLAWLLAQGAQIAKDVAVHVKALMSAILHFLGRKLVGSVDVTQAFVRWLLALLMTTLTSIARRALDRVR